MAPPKFPSGFMTDKRGRVIKTEEDFAVAALRLADGRKGQFRNGKRLSIEPLPEKHTQEQKKADLTQNEDRRSQSVKTEIDRKAKKFQL